MSDIAQVFQNQVLLVSLLACFTAQALKLIVELVRNGKFSIANAFTTGGMPSSHSALVASLATCVGLTVGWASPEFAIASLFATIVMYDAAGVRQAAGKQAQALNQLIDELASDLQPQQEERLKEKLGHTPLQVVVGSAWGIAVALLATPFFLRLF
ncbi:MAG: divergent PAP2 family protein [Cyanobacteria bacterium J06641_5]